MPDNFAIHVLLAHAASNQLGILRTEVQDQNPLVGDQTGWRDGLRGGSAHRQATLS
jgi:hypothetical protein